MTWLPANTTDGCFTNFFTSTCQPSFLTFLTLLTQYLGQSHDDNFRTSEELHKEYDFIVVGAGSTGSVVANRLSEIKNWKVLLLEAGDEQPIITNVPALFGVLPNSNIDYSYSLQRDPELCKRNPMFCVYPRGKVMGGTSSINCLMYNRGNKQDFNYWANQGNPGWSWKDVLPYFKKSENLKQKLPAGDPKNHGTGGYLNVELREKTENYDRVFLNSWKELGLKEVDYNSGNQIGVSKIQYTMKNGARQSTNDAFIRPIRGSRSNLTIRPKTRVTKIIIDPQTKRAIGVEYVTSGKKATKKVYTKKEVIVSAGAIDSPKLLMLSGIGPANDLRNVGIQVIKDLPVGKNYQDHVSVNALSYSMKDVAETFDHVDKNTKDVVQFLNHHKGPYRTFGGLLEYTVYLQTQLESRPGLPDIELFYLNSLHGMDSSGNYSYIGFAYRNSIVSVTSLSAPKSRGWIKLNNTDPTWGKPLIYPNFYSDRTDLETLVEGLKFSKRISNTKAFVKSGLVASYTPAPLCEKLLPNEDAYFKCFAENYHTAFFHAAGTCKMGPKTDPDAVVDSELRVHGIKGLRVMDTSIMPNLTRANTNAPTIMIAEKGSDMIKKHWL